MHSQATETRIGIDTAVVADHRVAVRSTAPAEDFAVPPTLAGMAMLTRRLAEHAPALAVAEPTGMTWLAVGHAVRAAGCDLTLVQPRHSARLRGAIAGKHKTDVADADMLAGCADVFGLTAATLPSPAQIALRRAVRRRHRAIVDAHRGECRLWALAAWAFPDVWHACQHAQPLLQTLLRRWPHLSQLARARTASIAALCRQRLRRPGDVDRRAERIRAMAAGWADFWQNRLDLDALAWEITELLDDIAAADTRSDRAAGHAHQLWRAAWDHDDLLCSLPGIGATIAPTIRAWFGDATQFDNGKQAAAFVGLNPSNWESGLMAAPSRPITKEGPPELRLAFYQAANVARRHDPQLAAFYWRLMVERSKTHIQANCAVARKLTTRVWATLTSTTPYELRDLDGTPIDRRDATELAAKWTVPADVRRRTRTRATAYRRGRLSS
jgi:transposase